MFGTSGFKGVPVPALPSPVEPSVLIIAHKHVYGAALELPKFIVLLFFQKLKFYQFILVV